METDQLQNRFTRFRKYYHSLEPILEKPKNRAYTAVVFSFLAISLFSWYAIKPTMQTILYLRREISDKSVLNDQMEQKISNLIEAQTEYETYRDKLYLIDDAIPVNPDSIDAVLQLRNLINTSPATISAVRVESVPLIAGDNSKKPAGAPNKENIFGIGITLEGDYVSLEYILSQIYGMRRILTIENIHFAQNSESIPGSDYIQTGRLELSLKLKSYYK